MSNWKAPIFPYNIVSGDDTERNDEDSAARNAEGGCCRRSPLRLGRVTAPPDITARRFHHLRGQRSRILYSQSQWCPEHLRGTYAGLACDASINYLKKLGVTAVELLPVHHFIDEGHLVDRGLRDYWGYNTLGYFAPMSRYSSCGDNGCQVDEFKQMVKALHKEGIEVILDVVYNHTCEGNRMGPILSWKGVSTTQPITVRSLTIPASTWTTPAPETRST